MNYNVVLQPAGNKEALFHLERTVISMVKIADIATYLKSYELMQLNNIYISGNLNAWGIVSGKNSSNRSIFLRIRGGDYVLFFDYFGAFYSAKVTLTITNSKLAAFLWGMDSQGQSWENIYFLKDVNHIRIGKHVVNNLLKRKMNANVQRCTVIDYIKARDLIKLIEQINEKHN